MQKTRTTVKIGGRDYTIVGEDPPDRIRRVSAYVDRKMDELTYATRLSQPMVAVLTAMNIANDLLKAQDENTRLRREIMETRAARE